ncbi:S41 family peptidase [Alistipes onderdonkii]|jgi:hypothetical protein|uniref:S41 family peptidase n=1 Tax=Alistipes onderdonkii TaxID=328813 RepID=UPI001F1AD7F8|nr:S41 family peptidase [Alistipes onderdonkii]
MRKNVLRLLLTTSAIFCLMPSQAQDHGRDSLDFVFAVRQVEQNYAGYPSAVTDADRGRYEDLKARLMREICSGGRKGYDAVGELFGWFGDFHLRAGIYSEPYMRRRADYGAMEYAPVRSARPIDSSVYLIRIPSFEYDETLMAWVAEAAGGFVKSGCDYLVVDIRGNGGGRDQAYQPLLELLYDHPGKTDNVEIRVSADNEAFLRNAIRDSALDWLLPAADSMARGGREFVAFPGGDDAIEFDAVSVRPRRAAVIIDGNVASSGEQFVLDVRACSARTKIYGRDNTLGCLDFSNCMFVDLPYSKITLSVPVTRSKRLPDRGIDKTGIAPDVRIPLPLPATLVDNVDPWVEWVAGELKK